MRTPNRNPNRFPNSARQFVCTTRHTALTSLVKIRYARRIVSLSTFCLHGKMCPLKFASGKAPQFQHTAPNVGQTECIRLSIQDQDTLRLHQQTAVFRHLALNADSVVRQRKFVRAEQGLSEMQKLLLCGWDTGRTASTRT